MATLVTLEQAKVQLRLQPDDLDHDDDITLKIDQATDIVLDYLNGRTHRRAVIVSSSVANPTVITTDDEHGYTTGDMVLISGHGSTPALAGPYAVTVISPTTFSVPVAVTVAGEDGDAVVEWTTVTVPKRVQWAVLQVLEDLYERRPINWPFVKLTLERSRDLAIA